MSRKKRANGLLDQTQLAAALGVTRGTLRWMTVESRVPRTLRWPADVVEKILAQQKGGAE